MRVGIVGAGLNSDYHINFSKAYGGAKIVGIADNDLPRAQECAKKHGITGIYGSVIALLLDGKPDVVHVVTPPQTHYDVVREVLEAKCHVLVEKPLALNWEEANDLYDIAERKGVKLCPVHNHLFDPCMRKADELIKQGALGKVINVESYYGLNTVIPAFRDYPRPNVVPWLYGLPGGVYQDFLPHALYVLLEYTGAPRELKVMQRTTGVLPQNLPDEIRILVNGENAFGTVTFSFAAKPHLHFIRVYGTRMMTEIDINTMTTVVHRVSGLPKAAQKVIYNIQESWQQTRTTVSNVYRFLTGKLKPYHGMMTLIHLYYDAIRSGNPPPVSRERALLVIKTMDEIFKQLTFDPLKHERFVPDLATKPKHPEKILVTGGTGFVGKRLVERLIEEGYAVRVLARKLANVDTLRSFGAEVFWGDVADHESFEQALIGNDIIVHLAAGTSGSEKDCATGTLQGTTNVLDLCRRHKPGKLVYISSCSVYGVADFKKNQLVPESAFLERFPEKRGSYSASKQEAETYVTEFMKSGDVPAVVLRPGTIFGPGGDIYTPMMGFSMGKLYVIIGNGKFLLPFVYIDNLVDAIIGSIETKKGDNQVFNVVDMDRISKREYMNKVIRKIHPDAKVLYFPYWILNGITWFQEIALGLLKRRPFLTRYRLDSSQKSIVYDNRKIVETLGWHPRVDASEAFDRIVAFEASK